MKSFDRNYVSSSNIIDGKNAIYYYGSCPAVIENIDTKHITLVSCSGTIIKNNKVIDGDGINIMRANNIQLISNSIENNGATCLNLEGDNAVVRDNNITGCSTGINIGVGADGNNIENNIITGNTHGLLLFFDIIGNTINSNVFCPSNNNYDFRMYLDVGQNSGDNNKCEKPDIWNDAGTTGCTYSCKEIVNMNLDQGWNLISSSVDLEDNSLASFKGMVNYDSIFSYDNKWIAPALIDERYGMWVYMLSAGCYQISGLPIEEMTYNIDEGWNLINYPFLESKLVEEVFFDVRSDIIIVYAYDGVWGSYKYGRIGNSLTTLKPGMGIWIKANKYSNWEFNGEEIIRI